MGHLKPPVNIIYHQRPTTFVRIIASAGIFTTWIGVLVLPKRLDLDLSQIAAIAYFFGTYIVGVLLIYRIYQIEVVLTSDEITLITLFRTTSLPRSSRLTLAGQRLHGLPLYCLSAITGAHKRRYSIAVLGTRDYVEDFIRLANGPQTDWLFPSRVSRSRWSNVRQRGSRWFSSVVLAGSLWLSRCLSALWSTSKWWVKQLWREVHPGRLARMYIALVVMAVAIYVGFHFVPQPDVAPPVNASVAEIDVSMDHPDVGMYVGFYNLYNHKYYSQLPFSTAGDAIADYQVLVALDIKSSEKVRWTVTLAETLSDGAPGFSLQKVNTPNFPTNAGVSVSNDPNGTTISGLVQGPVNGAALLSDGVFGLGKHFGGGNPSPDTLVQVSLSGWIPGLVSKQGAALSVAMPPILPEQSTDPSVTDPVYAPATLTAEEDVLVGPYSVQTGNAAMQGQGNWNWFDNSGGIIIAQATGIDPSVQSSESRNTLYAGIAFGVAGSALLAAILEYRRPRGTDPELDSA